jgi:hypothetical protein
MTFFTQLYTINLSQQTTLINTPFGSLSIYLSSDKTLCFITNDVEEFFTELNDNLLYNWKKVNTTIISSFYGYTKNDTFAYIGNTKELISSLEYNNFVYCKYGSVWYDNLPIHFKHIIELNERIDTLEKLLNIQLATQLIYKECDICHKFNGIKQIIKNKSKNLCYTCMNHYNFHINNNEICEICNKICIRPENIIEKYNKLCFLPTVKCDICNKIQNYNEGHVIGNIIICNYH